MEEVYEESLKLHREHKGKVEMRSKVKIEDQRTLSLVYTPGVAQVCREIAEDPKKAYQYTIKSNTVAIVTDGSRVLGLGNIGGMASIPVMEGKAVLFKEFADIDAFPICFESYTLDFVEDVKNISPIFGAINLEDIDAPKCFRLEEELQDIGIPVMHDDQHGTAVVTMAAVLNACRIMGRDLEDLKVAVSGAGAAGFAITRLINGFGVELEECRRPAEILVCDSKGLLYEGREDLAENKYKEMLARETNPDQRSGSLADAMEGADVFIGVSAPSIVTEDMVRSMADDPVVLALANPVPEIMPDKAKAGGARIVATGRSDFPNQTNNVLAFPGIFRGALDAHAARITSEMKSAAVQALADFVEEPTPEHILPDPLDRRVAWKVADAVKEAAIRTGVSKTYDSV